MTIATEHASGKRQRRRIVARGAVQGVGFRPFVHRLALDLGLAGWVGNTAQGVVIEVEGVTAQLEDFETRLRSDKPPLASLQSLESAVLDQVGHRGFRIERSDPLGEKSALVLPDAATCEDCLREVFDPGNRRHDYPFTNCTNCGPRYSIIEALPYDRPRTTMKRFRMCVRCRSEYEDPGDRRFHAQPNACPACGPQLESRDAMGRPTARGREALERIVAAIRDGQVAAVKGLGGFHLLVDACNEAAVRRLRRRKHREEKPLALMMRDLQTAAACCRISPLEERLLSSPECPIVLLEKLASTGRIAPAVAPANPCLGVMLPCTPLHHLLLARLDSPVVATSGNLSDEPLCYRNREALERLAGVADLFLVHDRPILRPIDDSIVRLMAGRPQVLRRARGYAPLPVTLDRELSPLLAVGAHLKSTVACTRGPNVFVSQHLGDLETVPAESAFREAVQSLSGLFELAPEAVAVDAHPEYVSSRYARGLNLPVVEVQHHFAHLLSCMADNELCEPVLGVVWDGTGYGPDGTVWGGEFLLAEGGSFRRVAHFRPFRLPGSDAAVREPRRTALGLLHEAFGAGCLEVEPRPLERAFQVHEARTLIRMLSSGFNSPRTSSAGRLFDAVAALTGLRNRAAFEGQPAMELEFATTAVGTGGGYRIPLRETGDRACPLLDWQDMLEEILDDLGRHSAVGEVSSRFHQALADAIVAVAQHAGIRSVALTGGCFQNRVLTELAIEGLQRAGFQPYWHQRVPPNDGGIALGQAVAAANRLRGKS